MCVFVCKKTEMDRQRQNVRVSVPAVAFEGAVESEILTCFQIWVD